MAYQALYRKYRPKTFSDVVGQPQVTKTLTAGIKDNKTVHAYLFTGTRGTGKTSCAKILAKAVNCQSPVNGDPCLECSMCRAIDEETLTDIVEIDAASNTGVDYIRELREQVSYPPVSARYRVYIIDEVHMLSGGAFNALLKTLEEPPEYVIFILATTEVHKLPATILSRCQRFDFKRIDSNIIAQRIKYIADSEGFKITDDAATLIAGIADGGMRDAISVLDLCAAASDNIEEQTVIDVCSMAGNDYLIEMSGYIKSRDTENALKLIDKLYNSSVDMQRFIPELIGHFRDLMMIKAVKSGNPPVVCSAKKMEMLKKQAEDFDIKEILAILGILQNGMASIQTGNARTVTEMVIIRLCNPEIRQDLASLELRIAALEAGGVTKTAPPEEKPKNKEIAPADIKEISKKEVKPQEKPAVKEEKSGQPQPLDEWKDIVFVLQRTCPILAGILHDSKAYIQDNRILIDTKSEQFISLYGSENPIYRESIKKAAFEILGKQYNLGPYKNKSEGESDDPLAAFAEKLKEIENQKG